MTLRTISLILTLSTSAHAIINVEPLRTKLDVDRVVGKVEGEFKARGGNTQGIAVGPGFFVGGRLSRHLSFLMASGEYAHYDGETAVQKGSSHLRYNYLWTDWLALEAFLQAEHDQRRELVFRGLAGSGPRFTLFDGAAVGTAYMLEYNDAAGRENLWHRWSNYVALVWQASERITLNATAYYQPLFVDPGNYRVLGCV